MLEIVADSHSAIGAYEIMDRLTADGEGGMAKRPAPITVYRALDFLMEHGLVHRLASLNAYVACARGSIEEHKSQFLVCRQCGVIAELIDPAIEQAIAGAASGVGFQVATPVVEVAGVCPNCRPATAVRE